MFATFKSACDLATFAVNNDRTEVLPLENDGRGWHEGKVTALGLGRKSYPQDMKITIWFDVSRLISYWRTEFGYSFQL